MAGRAEYPSAADTKWALSFVLAAFVCAFEAARAAANSVSVGFGVAAVGCLLAAAWWSTRHDRLARLMSKTPAWEGVAVLDREVARGRHCVTVTLRNGRAWRWRIDQSAVPSMPSAPNGVRVRVWTRRLDVVARNADCTLWPVGLARRVPPLPRAPAEDDRKSA